MQDQRLYESESAGWLVTLVTLFLILLSLPGWSQSTIDENNKSIRVINPGTDLWRDVRQRDTVIEGISQIRGVDTGILINPRANQWTLFRVGPLIDYGVAGFTAIIVLIALFYLFRGQVKVEGGPSGKLILRFSEYERIFHWVLASVFLLLALSGLILLLGRDLLIPVLGHQLFSLVASSSKEAHNLFGPIFLLSLLLIFFSFAKKNLYARGDFNWLAKGGGMIGKEHPSSGFFNLGEKIWFWLLILIGLVISLSGLVLVSPSLGQSRVLMELSHVIHSVSALILIGVSLGHIYLATIGTEGTREGMKSGYVDSRWAQLHHDRWAEECEIAGRVISADEQYSFPAADESLSPAPPVDLKELKP